MDLRSFILPVSSFYLKIIKEELDKMKKGAADYQSKLDEAKTNERKILQAEIEALQSSDVTSKEKIKELDHQISVLKDVNVDLTKKNEELDREKQNAQKSITEEYEKKIQALEVKTKAIKKEPGMQQPAILKEPHSAAALENAHEHPQVSSSTIEDNAERTSIALPERSVSPSDVNGSQMEVDADKPEKPIAANTVPVLDAANEELVQNPPYVAADGTQMEEDFYPLENSIAANTFNSDAANEGTHQNTVDQNGQQMEIDATSSNVLFFEITFLDESSYNGRTGGPNMLKLVAALKEQDSGKRIGCPSYSDSYDLWKILNENFDVDSSIKAHFQNYCNEKDISPNSCHALLDFLYSKCFIKTSK